MLFKTIFIGFSVVALGPSVTILGLGKRVGIM